MRLLVPLLAAVVALAAPALAQDVDPCPPEGCPTEPTGEQPLAPDEGGSLGATGDAPAERPEVALVWAGLLLVGLLVLVAAVAWAKRGPGGLFWRGR